MDIRRLALPLAAFGALGALLCTSSVAAAQEEGGDGERIVPTMYTIISGYGTVGWAAITQGENSNAFTASFNPIFLFQFMDRFLFEAEFEFELEGGVVETGLEYAQLDFVATDNITLVGGKFLLPFGVFGSRLHPTWINKFPTAPPIYGHHISNFGAEPLLPILADLGVMGRGTITPGRWNMSLNAYVVNGPRFEDDLGPLLDPDGDVEIPELEFPGSSSDNNTNKAFGARLDFLRAPIGEINLSFLNGNYDDQNVLDFTAWNIAGAFWRRNFELRGEWIQTRQEVETVDGFPSVVRNGYYVQAAYRLRGWEPVLRWTQVSDTKLEGEVLDRGAWQFGIGLNYWFAPSIAIMGGYEINKEDGPELDNDRVVIHVAFGF